VKLTKDYKSFTNTFKDLQSKFERFEEADDRGIREIWQMNMTEAQELVEKIMHCDEVIHLQQLSVPWKRPTEPIFNFLNEGQAKGGDEMDGGSQAEMSNRGSQAINQSMMDSD
jgi:dynein regulatory complex protein 1